MKLNRVTLILLLLFSAAVFQLPAQQNKPEIDWSGLPDKARAQAPAQDPSPPAVPAPTSKDVSRARPETPPEDEWDLFGFVPEEDINLRPSAEQGNPMAQLQLGLYYAKGGGVPVDYAQAVKWFRKAAEQNNPYAQYNLGLCCEKGQGVSKDHAEAVKWYRKAAEQNNVLAQLNLGLSYYNGQGVPKDLSEAVKWFRRAAEQSDRYAQYNLGVCYFYGEGVPKDDAEAVKWYRKAAEQSHSSAETNLAFCYANGLGVPKDDAEAVKWYRKAAEQNYPYAQFNLGLCYYNGEGVTKDLSEAIKWTRKAAEQNVPEAQHNLATSYANGEGVRKNYAEAVKWCRKAAEQNLPDAQYNLGCWYINGKGVRTNYAEAVKWFRKAAEQNLVVAQNNLGNCYANGQGVPKDYADAVKWYRKAAEQNDAGAQNNLGASYANGQGVPKDYVEAYKWILLAAAQGIEVAAKSVASFERIMTREQIAQGQSLARNFKPRIAPPAGSDSSPTAIAESRPESSGTAFFITDDGYLITNRHVLGESTQVRVVTASGILPAKVVKVDAGNDLALLKVEGTFAALPVVASRTTKLGGTVFTVGFPNLGLQGFAPKLSRGEIGSLAGPQDDPRYFQISAPVQPGNSGGALVDEHGNVIGVVAAKLSAKATLLASGALPENVNYAVKSSFLLGFLESVPEVAAKLKDPNTAVIKSEDVVERAEKAAALALVY
jgi:TPR repeat protein